ncbi:jg18383, partial [Pararge aegeria aegeria]
RNSTLGGQLPQIGVQSSAVTLRFSPIFYKRDTKR